MPPDLSERHAFLTDNSALPASAGNNLHELLTTYLQHHLVKGSTNATLKHVRKENKLFVR